MKEIKMFMAYATEDEAYKNELSKHLSALKEEGYISEWSAGEVMPGADVMSDLRKRMSQCDIIALLLSADFVGSNHGVELEEMAFALKAKKGTRLVPIKIRACMLSDAYAQFSMLPDQSKPVDDPAWGSRDNAYMNIAEGIKKLAQSMRDEEHEKRPIIPEVEEVEEVEKSKEENLSHPKNTDKKPFPMKVVLGIIGAVIIGLAIWLVPPLLKDDDKIAYDSAKTANKIAAFEKYVSDFPEGKYTTEANRFISELKQIEWQKEHDIDWATAREEDDRTGYQIYLRKYPEGDSVSKANARIVVLTGAAEDRNAYERARNDGTVPAFLDYIKNYGKDGRHHQEAVDSVKDLLTSDGWAYYGKVTSNGKMENGRYFNQIEGEEDTKPKAGDLIKVKSGVTVRNGPKRTFGNKGSLSTGSIAEIVEIRSDGPTAFWVMIKY